MAAIRALLSVAPVVTTVVFPLLALDRSYDSPSAAVLNVIAQIPQ